MTDDLYIPILVFMQKMRMPEASPAEAAKHGDILRQFCHKQSMRTVQTYDSQLGNQRAYPLRLLQLYFEKLGKIAKKK